VPVTLEYDGARGPRRRHVRLRNVVMEGSLTLLNVTDIEDGAERQLRLDRVRRATLTRVAPASTDEAKPESAASAHALHQR